MIVENIENNSSSELTSGEINTTTEVSEKEFYGRKLHHMNPFTRFEGFAQYKSIAKAVEHIGIAILRSALMSFVGAAISGVGLGLIIANLPKPGGYGMEEIHQPFTFQIPQGILEITASLGLQRGFIASLTCALPDILSSLTYIVGKVVKTTFNSLAQL